MFLRFKINYNKNDKKKNVIAFKEKPGGWLNFKKWETRMSIELAEAKLNTHIYSLYLYSFDYLNKCKTPKCKIEFGKTLV